MKQNHQKITRTLAGALCLSGVLLISNHTTAADSGLPDSVQSGWTFTLENDLFLGDDSRYTNGVGVIFGRGLFDQFTPEVMPGWLYTLVGNSYINKNDNRKRAITFGVYQAMQTPENISAVELQSDDPPYAGLLAAQTELYSMSDTRSDRMTLTLGLVGPLSLAKQAQKIIHKVVGADDPKGWQHQLRNEPVAMIELQRSYRLWDSDPSRKLEMDTVVLGSGSLGNLLSEAAGTFVIRIGNNLIDSFPVVSVQPNRGINPIAFSSEFSWDIFAGLRAAYIANDISVNGNTFTDSHSQKLDHTQSQFSIGMNWNFGNWAFTASVSEFRNVTDADPFGSISITRRNR